MRGDDAEHVGVYVGSHLGDTFPSQQVQTELNMNR